MYTNDNLLRDIINQTNKVSAYEWLFTPSDHGIRNTGIIEVSVGFNDLENDIVVEIDFLANEPKESFFSDLGYVKVGGINFGENDSPVVSDSNITITKSFSEEKFQSELLAFEATESIELGAKDIL